MIRLQHVSACYEPGVPVLQDIDLTLPDQGVIAIMGPSGIGKTTLLKLLCGLVKPQSGSVRGLLGRRAVLQFQDDRLLNWCTLMQNVRLVMPRPSDEGAAQFLHQMEIEETDAYPSALSGGMLRRVSLARALAYQPDLLLLDEPFNGLDNALKGRIAPILRQATRLIILSTHDDSEVALMGASVINLKTEQQGQDGGRGLPGSAEFA
ncbi:MAG: ATP-binding cassette domain-containing protein [Christensenellales bacterium]